MPFQGDEEEFRRRIEDILATLPPALRKTAYLCLGETSTASYEEAARALGISVPAVKTRIHRIRNEIRKGMGEGSG